ncbi:MAG: GntR family transcriptional regulator [Chloroflexota bacterium]
MNIDRIRDAVEAPTPAPLHQKLRDAIFEQIYDGTLQAGETLPSERAMKEHFSVSRATVRQAVNTLIQEGYLQSVAGTGTFVLEQSKKMTSAGLLGLVTSSPNFNFFYPQLTAAFNNRIRSAGYGLVMSLHSEDADTLAQITDELLGQNVVGLAITPPRYGDITPILNRLRRQKIPVVLIGRSAEQSFDVVATDNERIGYEATQYLLRQGHEHIAFVGLLDYSTGIERANGYKRALEEAGVPPHIVQIHENTTADDQNQTGAPREHLVSPAETAAYQTWGRDDGIPEPTAAFCFNDITAMGVYKALRNLQRRIPADVSLVSVDNLITVRHFEVPLTTFALPGEEIGIRSAEILLRRLSGDAAPAQTVLLPATFIERESALGR